MDKRVFCYAVGTGSTRKDDTYVLIPSQNMEKYKNELCEKSIGIEEILEWDATTDPDFLRSYRDDLSRAIDIVIEKARSKTSARFNLFIERVIDGWKISCTVTADV